MKNYSNQTFNNINNSPIKGPKIADFIKSKSNVRRNLRRDIHTAQDTWQVDSRESSPSPNRSLKRKRIKAINKTMLIEDVDLMI